MVQALPLKTIQKRLVILHVAKPLEKLATSDFSRFLSESPVSWLRFGGRTVFLWVVKALGEAFPVLSPARVMVTFEVCSVYMRRSPKSKSYVPPTTTSALRLLEIIAPFPIFPLNRAPSHRRRLVAYLRRSSHHSTQAASFVVQ